MSSETSGRVCFILISAGRGILINKTLVMMLAAAVQQRNLSRSIHDPPMCLLESHDLETGVHWKMLTKKAAP